ncbi:MAG: sulfurtransferase [Burkholderiaceae bacterium]
MPQASTSGTLVTVEQLRNHLEDPGWCVIDVRHDLMNVAAGRRAYDAGHIPGAAFARIDDDLSGTKTGRNGRHPLPRREDLVHAFRRWGVDDDTQIVAYDAQGGNFAVRLWWLARWLGHARVALLDGGWPLWLAKTGLSSTEQPVRGAGHFSERPSMMPVVEVDEVVRNLGTRDRLVLDARTPERYRGDQEPIDPVAGHIPGARNRPWQSNLNPDQTVKPAALLRQEFEAALGTMAPTQVAHQCGSGVTACHNLLAMEIAGLTGSALYPGSWSEWIADAARPVAVGEEKSG